MRRDYDAIVIGLGGFGAAALYALARRLGGDVLGLEQFELGHVRGSSHDHSRIIRLSYHQPHYVRLAQPAYAAWAALEAEAAELLVIKTGGLDLAPRIAAIPMMDYSDSLTACGVPFEHLDAAEIMRRWPPFQVPDDVHGLYQAESGLVAAAKATAAHLRLASAHGAAIHPNAPVTALRDHGGELEVVAGGETYRCRRLVLAAGAWMNNLLAHFNLRLPLTITQEQVTYYATPHLSDFAPERFPVWIWLDEPCFYGFPVYAEPAVKVAQDVGGAEVTAETRTFTPDAAVEGRTTAFLERYLPRAVGPIHYTKTCLFELPPDRDFVLDTLPDHPAVSLAIGAGHGFKFAALIGRLLSELALDGQASADLTPFRVTRPLLQQADPPRHFMV